MLKLGQLAGEGRIDLVVPFQLHGLEGANGRLEAVIVAISTATGARSRPTRCCRFSGSPRIWARSREWGLNLHRNLIRVDPATCSTGRAGIYAIGDIVTYPGKLKLILTGFAEAAAAAHAAYAQVHPGRGAALRIFDDQGRPRALCEPLCGSSRRECHGIASSVALDRVGVRRPR